MELLLKFSSRILYKLNQLEIHVFLFYFKFKKIDSEFFTIKKTLNKKNSKTNGFLPPFLTLPNTVSWLVPNFSPNNK